MRTRDTTAPERRAYPFRAAAGAGDGMRIEGVASMFGSRNSYGEVFVPGAYAESLAAKTDAKPLPIGLYHREVVGRRLGRGQRSAQPQARRRKFRSDPRVRIRAAATGARGCACSQ